MTSNRPLLLAPLLTAQAPVLVPDVSQRAIEIAYSFTGAQLLLFGAILDPTARRAGADARTDVVVVVKGPVESILVRESGGARSRICHIPALAAAPWR